jgi:hypothetical protein
VLAGLINNGALIRLRNNCLNTGKSKLMTRSPNGFTTCPWVDLIIIIIIYN